MSISSVAARLRLRVRGRRRRLATLITAAAAATAVAGASMPAIGAGAADSVTLSADGETPGPAPSARVVRLISGDEVYVSGGVDGPSPVLGFQRPGITYDVYTDDGDWYVVPSDAQQFVASGAIDPMLFDVSYLVRSGYAGRDTTPVIAEYGSSRQSLSTRAVRSWAEAIPASTTNRLLDSVDAAAVSISNAHAANTWKALVDGPPAPIRAAAAGVVELDRPAPPAPLGLGVRRLVLDARVHVSAAPIIEPNITQVGAPDAWAAGYDGTGVDVAVLDTGVDQTHPDLDGVVTSTKSFVPDEPEITDHHGHGTHVASIIAGSGAIRSGVAPGAHLIVGKVLNGSGSGQLSWIIAGMQWAAQDTDARVVSMSLGASPSEGTEVLDDAVDNLTATTNTLFVIAAGNSGPGSSTLNSPGTADAALTVGAVDGSDQIASFSSRGPRLDDGAVKPEIVAPGVGIVAARAAGTSMGTPIDEYATSASGTSMATPHVAGAAAILAERRPGWTATQLKDALVGAADDLGKSAFDQGNGRLDVATAIDQTVIADPATVSLGWSPQTDPRSGTVTYTNLGDSEQTLSLSAAIETPDGEPLADDAVTLSATELTIPVGESRDLTVTVRPSAGEFGNYSGRIVAKTADGRPTTTALGMVVQPPMHTVTLTGKGLDGKPFDEPMILSVGRVDDNPRGEYLYYLWPRGAGKVSLQVPAGTYMLRLTGFLETYQRTRLSYRYLNAVLPEVDATHDVSVSFDATESRPVQMTTEVPTYPSITTLNLTRRPASGPLFRSALALSETAQLYVLPTSPPDLGSFSAGVSTIRIKPQVRIGLSNTTVSARYAYSWGAKTFRGYPALAMLPAGRRTVRIVDGGSGTPEALADLPVDDALVLIHRPTYTDVFTDIARRLRERHALGMIVFEDGPDPTLDTGPMSLTGAAILPSLAVSRSVGTTLLEQVRRGVRRVTLTSTPVTPFTYQLAYHWADRIPDDVHYLARTRSLAKIEEEFRPGSDQMMYRYGISATPADHMWNLPGVYQFWAPTTRTDYVGPASSDLVWRRTLLPYENPAVFTLFWWIRWDVLEPGPAGREVWLAPGERLGQLVRTDQPDYETTPYLLSRTGDTITPAPQRIGADSTVWGGYLDAVVPPNGSSVTVGLSKDGTPISPTKDGSLTVFGVDSTPGRYQLDLGYRPDLPDSGSYHVETSWQFDSERPADGAPAAGYTCGLAAADADPCRVEPLLLLDYDLPVGADNTASSQRDLVVGLHGYHQEGAPDPELRDVNMWVSLDHGETWRQGRVSVVGHDATATARLDEFDGPVSLRFSARDAAGSTISQTLYDVFTVHGSS